MQKPKTFINENVQKSHELVQSPFTDTEKHKRDRNTSIKSPHLPSVLSPGSKNTLHKKTEGGREGVCGCLSVTSAH